MVGALEPRKGMDRNQSGNWAEFIAAAWLVSQGYEHFVAQGNASCDMVALKAGVCTRVEVKKASFGGGNRPVVTGVDSSKHDLLLVVMPDGDVLVNPDSRACYGLA